MTPMCDTTEIRQWYDRYIAAESWGLRPEADLIQAVKDDELDEVLLEKRIADLRSEVPVAGRFCLACQALFDNWPDLSDSTTTHPNGTPCFPGSGADWKHAVARSCDALQLEAAARNGCLFCALLVQNLRDAQQLGVFRRVDARIRSLGEPAEVHLSLQNWGQNPNQLCWIDWPGRGRKHCNGGGPMQNLVIGALENDGEYRFAPGRAACPCHVDSNTDFRSCDVPGGSRHA